MLMPKNVRELMQSEQLKFTEVYRDTLKELNRIMIERGRDRDTETPIYIRRPPESNRSLAEGKLLRVQSLLAQLDSERPYTKDLRKLIEECVDIANYAIFIAVTCKMVLDEEEKT